MRAGGAAFTRPYVDALFEVAGSADAVEALLPSLEAVARALDASEELRAFSTNPAIPRAAKRALVASLAGNAGAPELAGRLLRTLLDRGRFLALSAVLDAIRERLDEARGVLEATVRAVAPLGADAETAIREALEARSGTRVRLRTELDPSLLSGFVVRLGSEVFDASLSRRLARARKALEGASGAA
ncbi:MAG TPA: ATP synthase F1 subunit delta [Thermoanaerobaculia bacterium]|nr:ATP synthase F1 subunit delta [Thermoanaerobaculia bacterium]